MRALATVIAVVLMAGASWADTEDHTLDPAEGCTVQLMRYTSPSNMRVLADPALLTAVYEDPEQPGVWKLHWDYKYPGKEENAVTEALWFDLQCAWVGFAWVQSQ